MKKWFIKMAGDKPRKRSASAGTQPVAKWNRRWARRRGRSRGRRWRGVYNALYFRH